MSCVACPVWLPCTWRSWAHDYFKGVIRICTCCFRPIKHHIAGCRYLPSGIKILNACRFLFDPLRKWCQLLFSQAIFISFASPRKHSPKMYTRRCTDLRHLASHSPTSATDPSEDEVFLMYTACLRHSTNIVFDKPLSDSIASYVSLR